MPNNAGKYMIVPLSTFAQTFTNQNPSYGTLGAEYCAIYVEDIYLQDDFFILGAMFFQQFFAMFQTEIGSTQFSFVNIYANNQFILPGTYIGNAAVTSEAANPFVVTPATPQVTTTSGSGVVPTPAFSLTVGISAPAEYLLDFSSPNLYVWDTNCFYNSASCSSAPVYAVTQYTT